MSGVHGRESAGCREIFARLSEYLDGELDAGVCADLEAHLGDCPPCQAFLESLRRTVRLMRALPARELPAELKEELIRAYREARRAGGI